MPSKKFYLCFFRGSGDYELYVRLNIDGGITGIDEEFGVINKVFQPSNTDFAKNQQIQVNLEQFPISMFQYYEGIAYGIISRIYFTWLASVWQEVGGNNCGLTTQITENNSCSSFYLNDFSWDDLSNYSEYDGKPKRIDNLFIRNLSVEEIFIRVGFKTYPVNPYKYFWRYFEKDGYFWEIACYSNQIGKRKGKIEDFKYRKFYEIYSFDKIDNSAYYVLKNTLLNIKHFADELINDGWNEKLRPMDFDLPLNEETIETDFHSGTSWFYNEYDNRLNKYEIFDFERRNNIELPNQFKKYLQLFNGRQYNEHCLVFPIDNLNCLRVKKFYNINELDIEIKTLIDNKYLRIGEISEQSFLLINVLKSDNEFGYVAISYQENITNLNKDFGVFVKHVFHAVGYNQDQYHAKENNVSYFKQKIEMGYDFSKDDYYESPADLAAENFAHETLDLLLEHGAYFRNMEHYKDMTWQYDVKAMEILDKYFKRK
jgi:hypothetical protein